MKIKLEKAKTTAPKKLDKEKIKKETAKMVIKLQEHQNKMFAQGKYSLLIIFQGMDAAGKDSAIKTVFSGLNPLGCNAVAFAKPTEEEYSHDFLRRIHQHTPAKGMVQIFNRSYYEDILVPTVEKIYHPKEIAKRYDDINNFEELIQENDTIIVKFFLDISHDKQEEKLQERITRKDKHWKFDPSDARARAKWKDYIKTYEQIFEKCDKVKRHIVPADQKRYKNYCIAKVILEAFNSMKLERPDLPETADDQKKAIKKTKDKKDKKDDKDKKKNKEKNSKKDKKKKKK